MAIRVSVNRVDLDDKTLQKPELKDYGETRVSASSGAAYTIDLEQGNVFEITLSGDPTFTFSNPPASGVSGSFTLIVAQGVSGGRIITWPSSVEWEDAVVPVISTLSTVVNIFTFTTTNGGTVWYGFLAAANPI